MRKQIITTWQILASKYPSSTKYDKTPAEDTIVQNAEDTIVQNAPTRQQPT
jgi:hypothetical protein